MRDWISKRRIKKAWERIDAGEPFTFDRDNASVVEGVLWERPHGIWQPEDYEKYGVIAFGVNA